MKKRALACVVIIAVLLHTDPVRAETSILIPQENIRGALVRDFDDSVTSPELKVFQYSEGQGAVKDIELAIVEHDVAYTSGANGYSVFGNGILPASGREGYFAFTRRDRGAYASDEADIHVIDGASDEKTITSVNIPSTYGEQIARRYILMHDGSVVAKAGYGYEIIIIQPDTREPVPLAFDYGEYVDEIPQFIPLEVEYSRAREQYIVLYYQSQYTGGSWYDSKYDHRLSWAGIALFDKNGRQVSDHRLEGLYYADWVYFPGQWPSYTLSDTPILVADDTGEIYVWGLTKQEYVKSRYNNDTDWATGAEREYGPWGIYGTNFARGTCYTRISLDTGAYEIIGKEEFMEQITVPEFPFTIELRGDGTYILDKADPAAPPLAYIEGDYIPVDYSINTDDSWQVILASSSALTKNERRPDHPNKQNHKLWEAETGGM